MIALKVNGEVHQLENVDPEAPLLWVLRDTLGLTGTKGGKDPAKQLVGRNSGDRNSEIGVAGQTMRKIPMR